MNISKDELFSFNENGYLKIDNFLNKEECENICLEISSIKKGKNLLPNYFFRNMIFDKRFMYICSKILGENYAFHHANGQVLSPINSAKSWHHDYDALQPWEETDPMMIHIIVYPAGLTKDIGTLSVLPKSHTYKVKREYPNKFNTGYIDGQIDVIGEPGFAVVFNSALWHLRNSNHTQNTRCYFNYSYFQFGIYRPEREELKESIELAKLDNYHDISKSLKERLLSLNHVEFK